MTAEPRVAAGSTPGALLLALRRRADEMLRCVEELVVHESPSREQDLLDGVLGVVDAQMRRLLGSAGRRVAVGDTPHLLWESGTPRVLILCHADTVWPRGTLDRWPFSVDDGRATGPGCFDMKAGIVQALFAMSELGAPDDVRILVTTDEEIGSPSSRELIERSSAGLRAALVLEPAYDGALKIARKGVSQYTVRIEGRAYHASEPDKGANAALEMAQQMLDVARLADDRKGTTAMPSLVSAGTTSNTVPAYAEFSVDSRAASVAEQERFEADMRALRPHNEATRVSVDGGINRAPMPESISRDLFARARSIAASLGLPALTGVEAPGGSDGQFTAGVGTPTLDGLGAVGGNAHAEGEWVDVATMPERAALLAILLQDLIATS